MRIIKTARTIEEINKAALEGFTPLVLPVKQSDEISVKFSIYQNKLTGEVYQASDYRDPISSLSDFVEVIKWTRYYPYNFENPFAAYLVPKDIQIGERVFLEDVIEDIVGEFWNQGDKLRLHDCMAVWDGEAFKLEFTGPKEPTAIG